MSDRQTLIDKCSIDKCYGHVHEYQTPNWSLKKVKKMNFAHKLLTNLLVSEIPWTGG